MSFEVAAAHVSIFPKFATGFGRQLRGQMNTEGGAAGREGGRSAGVGFMSVLKGVLGAVVTLLAYLAFSRLLGVNIGAGVLEGIL